MSDAPVHEIDLAAFTADPYPDLARMRAECPICFVPQLGATLLTRRDDIHRQEKRIEVFSSTQPDGLMTRLMGENMMRRDGAAHLAERKVVMQALSPRAIEEHWRPAFRRIAEEILAELAPRGRADLVRDYAMPLAARALCAITGLENMPWQELDRTSQGMIDGISNYAGDPEVEARCLDCVASIDRHIDERIDDPALGKTPNMMAVMKAAGLDIERIKVNIRLTISGGQNEPRDVIAGAAWALLAHPDQRALIAAGAATWEDAFAEYTRWISPIMMSPRRIARRDTVGGVTFEPGDRAFLMFGSANRDEAHFEAPERFDITRDSSAAIVFGSGPHLCAGKWVSRAMIADVALPLLFERLPGLQLDPGGETRFTGWAFRGPVAVPVLWDHRAATPDGA